MAATDDLDRLEVTRNTHRRQLTKITTKAEEIISRPTAEIHPKDITALSGQIDSIRTKMDYLLRLDTEIQESTTLDKLEETIIEADDYQESVKEKFYTIWDFFEKHKPKDPSSSQDKPATSATSSTRPKVKNVSLPKLTLAKYDGDILQWTSFFDSFNAAVHKDTCLDDVQKFQYLRAHVTGEAAKAIAGLQLTNENYQQALDLLIDRYGQRHKIIDAYMKALWELPKPTTDLASLQNFSDRLESYIRGLSSLGKDEDGYGDLLIPIIREKLPKETRKLISREHGNREWTLHDLRSAIRNEIDASRAGEVDYSLSQDYSDNSVQDYTLDYSSPKSTAAFLTNTHTMRTTKPRCAFCKDSHASIACVVVTDPQKRFEIVKRDRLCFNCFGSHRIQECNSKYRCRKCNRKHHTAICAAYQPKAKPDTYQTKHRKSSEAPITEVHAKSVHNRAEDYQSQTKSRAVLLKTAVAGIRSGSETTSATILFDEGATRSFVTRALATQLNLKPDGTQTIHLAAFGQDKTQEQTVDCVTFEVITTSGSTQLISALVVPQISTPMSNYVTASLLDLPYLRNLRLAHPISDDVTFDISVLIGADFYWSLVQNHVIRGNGPTAVASKLGYLLSGPAPTATFPTEVASFTVIAQPQTIEQSVAQLWDLESIGIRQSEDQTHSNPSDVQSFKDHYIEKVDNQYVAKLPWKSEHPPLPNNYSKATATTRSMVRKLTPELRNVYNRIIVDQESRGFIERVPNDDVTVGHYLPHHSVKKDSVTTPIRVVYNCSAKANRDAPSLNDCLQKGPTLLNELTGILLRFRVPPIAITSDIEKAFLHVGLHESDRDFTKFSWITDPEDPESEFATFRFASVLFGSVSSPAILNAVVQTHLDQYDTPVAKNVKDNIYVDNVMAGALTEDTTLAFYRESNDIFKEGGFTLRAWASNCPEVREIAQAEGVLHPDETVPALGLTWNTASDQIGYKPYAKLTDHGGTLTKREVTKRIASIYDPLGYLAPVQVRAKIFLQSLWKQNLEWDQPFPQELAATWADIESDLQRSTGITVPRQYFSETTEPHAEYELHCFADASAKAYGAVIYLRAPNGETSLIMAKTRVAPVKEMTIPRLELMAAVLGTRLTKFATEQLANLNISKHVLWSDSQIVLSWLRSDKLLPLFVRNRISEIKAFPFHTYSYCPTADNPADLLTRGITTERLEASQLWWHGPKWLKLGDWPISEVYDSKVEVQHEHDEVITENVNLVETATTNSEGIDSVVDIDRFSSLQKLTRVTALVQRFIHNLRNKDSRRTGPLTANELTQANELWIHAVQQKSYAKEIASMKSKGDQRPLVRQLRLYLDKDNTLRCGGRLHNAPVAEDTKFPILLPPQHRYTKLVIIDAHERTHHSGLLSTVTFLRQTYWITKIRTTVKSVLWKCVRCKRITGRPYQTPLRAPLPEYRVSVTAPFSITGIDFSGEIFVKAESGPGERKCYILLFTCATTRAIHLELVSDLSTQTFLRAFRRFAARRSLPKKLISDNASTFQSAAKEIKELFANASVKAFMANRNVEWAFIPKRAPWYGGFWERLIGLTKNALKKALGRAYLTFDELNTVLSEIEANLNERPITYTYCDFGEPSPLTPSDLLHGRRITAMPHVTPDTDELKDATYGLPSPTELQKRNRVLSETLERFRSRWVNEYLPALREYHNAQNKLGTTDTKIKVGDIVLVHCDSRKRLHWNLAVVTKLIYGNDGLVRAAEIRTAQGHTNRPVVKLYPLEVSATETVPTKNIVPIDNSTEAKPARPARKAAIEAKERIRNLADDMNSD